MARRVLVLMAVWAALLAGASCAPRPKAARQDRAAATIEADGTIVVRLQSTARDGTVSEALVRYPLGHPHYADVQAHVGELSVGRWKQLPAAADVPARAGP